MSALLEAALRVRAVELRLARARGASELLGKHIHALGNALQIVELSSLELTRDSTTSEPLGDLREANERAGEAFGAMLALTKRALRTTIGPPVAPVVRAAVALVAPAVPVELRVELGDGACSRLARDELDAIVAACVLDAVTATRLTLLVRERAIENARWIELVRITPSGPTGATELVVEPSSWLAVVDALAHEVGGELSLSEGRDGSELVLAWPLAG